VGPKLRGWLVTASLVALMGAPSQASAASAAQISAGVDHACAVVAGGSVECWGDPTAGENGLAATNVGDGLDDPVPSPVGITDAISVAAGATHSCALRSAGTVACWGDDTYGELGGGGSGRSYRPVAVKNLSHAVAIGAGDGFSCALVSDGTARCWGDGGGFGPTKTGEAQVVRGLSHATALSVGEGGACAIVSGGGGVGCWGYTNPDGSVPAEPVAVSGLGRAVAVSVGNDFDCAVIADGSVQCWGAHTLGTATTSGSATPVVVTGITHAIAVSAGWAHVCVVMSSGTVDCWGTEPGLGDGTDAPSPTPVEVSHLHDAGSVAAGSGFTCAVRTGGGVACWGQDRFGDVGDLNAHHLTPVALAGLGAGQPVFGKTATVQPVSGTVRVRVPKTSRFVPLSTAATLPLGTQVDTTAGRVRLTAARGPGGQAAAAGAATQTSLFYGGQFRMTQMTASSGVRGGQKVGLTVLTLTGATPSGCSAAQAGQATLGVVSRRRPTPKAKQRSLWGSGTGDWRTVGTNASATVRGTQWFTEDTCAGTLVRVARGVVSVDDFRTHQTVLVHAGHSFLAKAKGGGSAAPPRRGTTPSRASLWSALGGKLICGLAFHVSGSPTQLLCSDRVIPAPKHTTSDEGDPGFVYLPATGTAHPTRLSQYSWQSPNGYLPSGHKALSPGQRWALPGLAITCTIGASSVRCVNAAHHGFTITLESYRGF
jgi:alpha-tubulin suppressor-like RCC1 family protein